ncbi:MAG TPA: TonB-dependent receptor [Bryobacteraceae bacterium]|nr:TonB-dependent receptor [Bryobacteraceae bacterium]
MLRMLPVLLLCLPALAQSSGRVSGVVVDARGGEPLARVQVQLTGTAFSAVTGATGGFAIEGIPPGEYTLHVSTVGFRLLTRAFVLGPREVKEFEVALSPDTFRQVDRVEVRSGPFDLVRQDSPSQLVLAGTEARNLGSVLADDPIRAVQSLPGVASNDDFNAQFSIHGAGYHRIGVYLDDFLLHTPFHTVQQEVGGSLTMFNSDMLEAMELHPAAFPSRFGDRTGAALDVHTREGSRSEPSFRAAASFSNVSVMGEGPLGKRGSWAAGARKSYLQYLIGRSSTDSSLAFGFTDTQGRISYDPARRHNVSLSYLEGYSDLDRSRARDRLGANAVMNANYHVILANAAWRYTPREDALLSSRLVYLRERFGNRNAQELELGAGYYGEWTWRTDGTWAWSNRTPLDAGISIRRLRDDGFANRYQFNPFAVRRLDEYRGNALRTGGYAEQSWSGWEGHLHATVGGRWDRHSITGLSVLTPQGSVGFVLGSTRLQFGWGQYAQFPEMMQLLSRTGSRALLPERATHYVASVEQRLGDRTRLRAEFYQRYDRDLLFQPLLDPRILEGRIFNPPLDPPWRNSMRGYARGIDLFLQRRSANKLTGWISYSLGYARVRDGVAGVNFPADRDQRHTINIFASYRLLPSVNLSAKWLYGSGYPIPGFLAWDGSRHLLAAERNALRMGPYRRADLRVNKAWAYARWTLTLYGEVVNLTNRRNRRFDVFNGYNSRTGYANLTFDTMFPILPSLGLVLEK